MAARSFGAALEPVTVRVWRGSEVWVFDFPEELVLDGCILQCSGEHVLPRVDVMSPWGCLSGGRGDATPKEEGQVDSGSPFI